MFYVSPNRCSHFQALWAHRFGEDGLRSDWDLWVERQEIRSKRTRLGHMAATIYHWGSASLGESMPVVVWALAFVSYNKGLPLTHPLCVLPDLGRTCLGLPGSPDRTSFAVFATALWLGDFAGSGCHASQRGSLNELFGLHSRPDGSGFCLITGITAICDSTVSARLGRRPFKIPVENQHWLGRACCCVFVFWWDRHGRSVDLWVNPWGICEYLAFACPTPLAVKDVQLLYCKAGLSSMGMGEISWSPFVG